MVKSCMCARAPPRFDEYACQQQIQNEFEFWQAAIIFQKHKFSSHKRIRKAARKIFALYLANDAPSAIALNRPTLTKIKADLKRKYASTSLFQEAILEISALLEQHFRNFIAKYKIKSDLVSLVERKASNTSLSAATASSRSASKSDSLTK